jgi:TfoX/Sxy family transcriptional regulator of competence genes
MAYDEMLDARIRGAVEPWGAERKAMFGGTAYMLSGNLFAGTYKDRLLIRVSPEDGVALLQEPGATPFDMMRRPMPGWITIDQAVLDGDGLEDWLSRGRCFAESLPAK